MALLLEVTATGVVGALYTVLLIDNVTGSMHSGKLLARCWKVGRFSGSGSHDACISATYTPFPRNACSGSRRGLTPSTTILSRKPRRVGISSYGNLRVSSSHIKM